MRGKVAVLIAALLVSTSWASVAHSTERRVPDPFLDIQTAINAVTADTDIVVITGPNHETDMYEYTGFILDKSVPVLNWTGHEVIIDASDTLAYAAQLVSYEAVVRGFTLKGGTRAVARMTNISGLDSCQIVSPSGGPTVGVIAGGYPTVSNCTFSMTGGTGIQDTCITTSSLSSGTIENCRFTLADGIGIYIDDCYDGSITNCDISMNDGLGIFVFAGPVSISGVKAVLSGTDEHNEGIKHAGTNADPVTNCLISVPAGIGIDTPLGSITHCTVDSADIGFFYGDNADYCIASNVTTLGFVGYGGADDAWYCITDLTDGYDPEPGTGSVVEDPLFCDAASGEYTLRVDSYGNPEVNGAGVIGAYPVACMYGTLVRDASFSAPFQQLDTLNMTGSVSVPDTLELTLDGDMTVAVTKRSPTAKLSVEGTLTVSGDDPNPVRFASAEGTPAEGDWYGIELKSSATAAVDFADIEYATYGVDDKSRHPVTITNSVFSHNATYDIVGSAGALGDLPLTVSHNTIQVGGGTGIKFLAGVNGAAVDTNVIQGSQASWAGVLVGEGAFGTVSIVGNTIGGYGTGFTAGSGIIGSNADLVVTGNTVSYNKYGVNLVSGGATIGGTNAASTNVISHNTTTGVLAVNPGTDPVIRHNKITSNTLGVVAKYDGHPDLGQSAGDPGLNKLFSNTTYCI